MTRTEPHLVQTAPKALARAGQEALSSTLLRKHWLTAHGGPPLAQFSLHWKCRSGNLAVEEDKYNGIRAAMRNATPLRC
jgi:hypothetical protein